MTKEARMERDENGLTAQDDGWFVLNAGDAPWVANERFGLGCRIEGASPFPHLGIHLRVLQPGQPACLYHSEALQEDFLVLSGECTLVVEGEERLLKAWDFFHCPPGTLHVFVGAGEGPCTILMVGARQKEMGLFYPVNQTAEKHGASSQVETPNPMLAYEGTPPRQMIPSPWKEFVKGE